MAKAKFVEVRNDGLAHPTLEWMEKCSFKYNITDAGATLIDDNESEFYISICYMQSGTISFIIVFTQADNYVRYKSGECKKGDDLESLLNKKFKKLTKEWLPQYLPE